MPHPSHGADLDSGLTARIPAVGATNVTTNNNITATFNVNVAGVTGTTFQIRRGGAGAGQSRPSPTTPPTRTGHAEPERQPGGRGQLHGDSDRRCGSHPQRCDEHPAGRRTSWTFTTTARHPPCWRTAPRPPSPARRCHRSGRNANVVTQFSEVAHRCRRERHAAAWHGGHPGRRAVAVTLNSDRERSHGPHPQPGATLLANTQYTLRLAQRDSGPSGNALPR